MLLIAGCSPGPVSLDDAPRPDGPDAAACAALVEALPDSVSGLERREVSPSGVRGAAWGDPPIELRCGVGEPAGLTDVSACQVVNSVGWFIPEEQITGSPTAIVMTTIDRSPRIEVRIPVDYFPPAATMAVLADAIRGTIERDDPCL